MLNLCLQRKAKREKSISEDNTAVTNEDADPSCGAGTEGAEQTAADATAKEGATAPGDSHSNNEEEWDSKSGDHVIMDARLRLAWPGGGWSAGRHEESYNTGHVVRVV